MTARPALVVGEALIDVVRGPDGQVREHVGGSPANVAFGLGRLGRPVRLLTQLGRDRHGGEIVNHLSGAGVDVIAAICQRTSTATATLDATGAASYAFDIDWSLPTPLDVGSPTIVHAGSLATMLQPGAATVAELVRTLRASATVSFDPNIRPALAGDRDSAAAGVERLVALSDVVKASDEDLAWLFPAASAQGIARRWLSLGPSIVVVTKGADGVHAISRSAAITRPRLEVDVVDTIGAGDAFTAGLLDALWHAGLLGADRRRALRDITHATLDAAVARGNLVAALTVSRPGANPPDAATVAAY